MRTLRAAAALAIAAVLLPGAAASALLGGSVGTTATRVLGSVTYDTAGTTRLYSLVNAHRRAHGLTPLAVDTRLAAIARAWTVSMATSGTLAHNDALFTKATRTLLGVARLGENVAYASLGVDRAHGILMESPPHRANIDNAAYVVGGFAVVRDAKGVTWVTEDFGSRPPAAAKPAVAPRQVAARAPGGTAANAAPAPRPAPRRVPARAVAPAAPVRPAAPRYAAPTGPRRESPTDRVDVPFDDVAPGTLAPAVRAAGSAPADPPAPVVLATLLAACGIAALRVSVVRGPRAASKTMEL